MASRFSSCGSDLTPRCSGLFPRSILVAAQQDGPRLNPPDPATAPESVGPGPPADGWYHAGHLTRHGLRPHSAMLVRCPRPQVSTSTGGWASTNPGAGNRRSDLLRVTGWWEWAGGSRPCVSSAVPRSWATSVGPSRAASGSPREVLAFGILGGGEGKEGTGCSCESTG